ncbi:MAG: hypothetical protein EBR10_02260 [Planctomycetes bacterium]|nr:hypothetical protein [Planctomycetota bacterium]
MTQLPDQSRQRQSENPRRVIGGFRFKRKGGIENFPWHADPLLRSILMAAAPEAAEEGNRYAISGQTATMIVAAGKVSASVLGRASRPYQLEFHFSTWSPEEWERLIGALSAEALYSARFLVDEMPPTVATLAESLSLGAPLVPSKPGGKSASDPRTTCTCGGQQPCKHAVAAMHILVERLETEPLLLFTLRGMPPKQVIERIQERRTLSARGESHAHPLPSAASDHSLAPPLASQLEDFWRPGRRLHDYAARPAHPHVPYALLRRLGASPLGGKFPLVGLLASIYDSLRTRGLRARDGDPPNGT